MKRINYLITRFNSKISAKLIAPIILLVMIIISTAFFRKVQDLKGFYDRIVLEEVTSYQKVLNDKVKSISEKSLLTSSMLAKLPSVQWAYKLYNNIEDADSAHAIIGRAIQPLIKNSAQITGYEPKVHLFLPPATSFYRTWSEKKGDDLSSYRNTILEVSQKHNPIEGIEVGKNGFSIHGISPIIDNKGTYLGAIQVSYPYQNVLTSIFEEIESKNYGLFISREKLKVAKNLEHRISTYNKNNLKTGKFILVQSSGNFDSSIIGADAYSIKKTDGFKTKIIDDVFFAFIPILDYRKELVGLTVIQVNMSEKVQATQALIRKNLGFGILVFIASVSLMFWLITRIVTNPIGGLSRKINRIAKGELIDEIDNKRVDELGHITDVFNLLLKRLKKSTEFANEIGEGNLDVEIQDVNEEDVLSHSLIQMRDNLQEARKQEELRKIEEDKRHWTTTGLAKFADILRQNNDDIGKLSELIVRNIVEYIGANQGGLFILNDNDENNLSLELQTAVAFERKKFLQKSIKLGEGLVGTCAIEKETIYLTEVPEEYINITSGLGKSNPRCILVVPLKMDDKIFGVIELASFSELEDYQIEFVELVSESIASTLLAVKTAQRTNELLEQSQQQSEELAAQEEEMRQNLEEMQATQEELQRNNEKFDKRIKGQLDIMNATALVSKTDLNGIITYANDLFTKTSGYSEKELIGANHNIIRHSDMPKAVFRNLWETIQAGKVWSGNIKNKAKDGSFYWVNASVGPILGDDGEILEYIAIRFLITDYINDNEILANIHKAFSDS